ncbi:MAG TPA: SpoIIE family protein phosphatase [Bacteroidia bacterium]|jgi:serine phosphatase RsbU (regulator of sigma subunit)/VIT1/CCC1 family predicted Fe2+/Mn2+ transporter
MQDDSLLHKLEAVDRFTHPEQFYALLWSKGFFLNNEEKTKAIEWSSQIKDLSEINLAHHSFAMGMSAMYNADFAEALSLMLGASDYFQTILHHGGLMACSTLLCSCYRSLGQLDHAQQHAQKALMHAKEVHKGNIYNFFKGVAYYQAGEINMELKNYDTAMEYYKTGIAFAELHPELNGRFLSSMGIVLMHQENWEEAIRHLDNAYESIKGRNHYLLESKILTDKGIYYFKRKDYKNSFINQEASLKIRQERGMHSPAITNYIKLAELFVEEGNMEEALRYGNTALEQSEKLKVNIKLYESHHVLSRIHELLGDIAKAYHHHKAYHRIREEVHSQEVIRKMEQIQSQHKVESAQQEKEIFRLRNVELKAAMDEITESFRYAKRIQAAILPPRELIREYLPESFVLFLPKDIVSGDFYWMETLNNKILLAAVDCTGHGVPGAMVSMVGHNCLNRAVHEFGLTHPAEILDRLTVLVEETFMHKDVTYDNQEDEIKDGMDISLCCIDMNTRTLEWAGANNPLWILRKGNMIEITADKQPVGKYDHRQPFTNHTIPLEAGDRIYLFTDGYADQFGGPHGKKFKYKQLKELLAGLSGTDMTGNKEVLGARFVDWQGQLEQVDDVLIIGFSLA